MDNLKICTKCIYDESISGIYFDESGICNYCHTMERFKADFGTGTEEGQRKLKEIIDQIKKDGNGKKYDCVVGVSGGTDSSYLLVKLVEWGLRPLAVHYDNTWNSAIATENIRKVLGKLKIDLFTYVIDNKEADDLLLSFMNASVPEIEAPTDLALAEVMYRAASKYNVKYVMEGHSFITEGIAPVGTVYFDGKYIASIHKKFGKLPMKTYPLMTFYQFMKWTLFKRIKKIRPLWYIPYSKEEAREYLIKEFNSIINTGLNLVVLIALPCSLGAMVYSDPVIQLVYERGVFDSTATAMTSSAFFYYAAGLLFMSVNDLMIRVYYSIHDMKKPMVYSAISVIINIILNFVLVQYMAHSGLALATSIASLCSTVMLYLGLRYQYSYIRVFSSGKKLAKIAVAAIISVGISYIIYSQISLTLNSVTLTRFMQLLIPIAAAAISYLFLLTMLKVDEVKLLKKIIKRKS